MTARISRALDHVLTWEGGYSDDPDDPGGRTRFGISERAHPEAWRDGPPEVGDAHRIYRENYWEPLRCGEIEDQRVATYLMDAGVNQGIKRAARFLQRSCRLLGEDIRLDGRVGPETLGATNRLDADRLIHVMVAVRAEHHTRLAGARARYRTFLYGWLRRDYSILGDG